MSKLFLFLSLIPCVTLSNISSTQQPEPEARIVYGEACSIKLHPFAVLYYFKIPNKKWDKCGGSLLTYEWVLSAAHCYEATAKTIKVIAGTSKQHFTAKKSGGVARKVIEHIIHSDYEKEVNKIINNDIMLVKVEKPFPEDKSTIKPVKLPPRAFTSSVSKAVVMGWGRRKATPIPDSLVKKYPEYFRNVPEPVDCTPPPKKKVLMCATVTVVEHIECQRKYPPEFKIKQSHICSTSKEYKSPCRRDGGGPLAVNDTIIGIISFGYGCGQTDYSVYTRVDKYFTFMRKNIPSLVVPQQIEKEAESRSLKKQTTSKATLKVVISFKSWVMFAPWIILVTLY